MCVIFFWRKEVMKSMCHIQWMRRIIYCLECMRWFSCFVAMIWSIWLWKNSKWKKKEKVKVKGTWLKRCKMSLKWLEKAFSPLELRKKVFKKVTNRLSRACPAYELKYLKFYANFSTWKLALEPKNEDGKNVNWYQQDSIGISDS